MTDKISGGCACGAVRYESNAEIEFSFSCYCRKCQHATGTGHASSFALPVEAVKMTGRIKEYTSVSDSGAATFSGFCPECGSPMTSRTARFAERLYFYAATLDQPSIFQPEFRFYEEAALPWDQPA